MKAMARRLLQFPQELERNIYIDAIAGRYGIASEELKRMVNSFGASMSREQVEEAIYQQIIDDLSYAAMNLPTRDEWGIAERGRVTKGTAEGLLAKV